VTLVAVMNWIEGIRGGMTISAVSGTPTAPLGGVMVGIPSGRRR